MRLKLLSGIAIATAAISLVPQATLALTVRTLSGSAIGMPSTFTKTANTPRSTFVRAGLESRLETVFVASEIAPERIETTRTLLTELKARRTDGVIVINLPADVLFDFDKATIRADAETAVGRAGELLQSYPTASVVIRGHTDAKGDDAYNEALSLRRAQAVATRLQDRASRPLDVQGFGERQPVAPNTRPDGGDDTQGRQQNRRVEIRITPANEQKD